MVTYPLIGNWVSGGGWLAQLGERFGWGHGALDTAGSGVIHMVGGVTALVGAMVLGPRQGKYDREGRPRPIPGHNIPMAILGTLILFFGWFGFNTGSVNSAGSGVIAVAAVNTMLSGALGGFSAMMYMMYFHIARRPDPGICCNGMLAGLVAITAPCAYVSPTAAVLIGIVAGALSTWSAEFVEGKLKIDDCVGAFAIHGVCGMWGVIALGLFACGQYGAGFNHVAKFMYNGKEWTGGALGLIPLGAPAGTPWGYTGAVGRAGVLCDGGLRLRVFDRAGVLQILRRALGPAGVGGRRNAGAGYSGDRLPGVRGLLIGGGRLPFSGVAQPTGLGAKHKKPRPCRTI